MYNKYRGMISSWTVLANDSHKALWNYYRMNQMNVAEVYKDLNKNNCSGC